MYSFLLLKQNIRCIVPSSQNNAVFFDFQIHLFIRILLFSFHYLKQSKHINFLNLNAVVNNNIFQEIKTLKGHNFVQMHQTKFDCLRSMSTFGSIFPPPEMVIRCNLLSQYIFSLSTEIKFPKYKVMFSYKIQKVNEKISQTVFMYFLVF